ncbi:MAG: hypothetical protein RIG26_01030 [Thalassospira sp.]|uniref:hypothetical protein n=1 Tax=Thalassospira sp. TaxID=1912094 RepID=UPI0032EAD762
MLSMRDIIDFAAMSEDLVHELNNPKTGLPDLGAVAADQAVVGGVLHECSATPCAANDVDGK